MSSFDPTGPKDRSGRSQAERRQAQLLTDLSKSLDMQHHNTSVMHQFGAAFEAPVSVSGGPSGFVGVADSPARSDHVHGGQSGVGTIRMTINGQNEPGWLIFDGTTIIGGSTLYPELWKILPATMKSGVDIVTPDWTNRYPINHSPSRTVGDLLGSHTTTIAVANLPASGVAFSTGGRSAAHTHGIGGGGSFVSSVAAFTLATPGGLSFSTVAATGTESADHAHSGTTNNLGSGTPMNTYPSSFDIYMKVLAY